MNLLPSSPTLFLFSSFCTFQSNIPLTFYYNRSSHSTLLPLLLIHIFVCNHTHARAPSTFLNARTPISSFFSRRIFTSFASYSSSVVVVVGEKHSQKSIQQSRRRPSPYTHTLLPPSHRQIDMHKLFLPMSSSSFWWWWFLLPFQPPTWILRAYEPTADCLHSSHILEPATTVETRPGNQSNRRSIVHRKNSTFAPTTQLSKHARWLPRRRRQLTQTVRI